MSENEMCENPPCHCVEGCCGERRPLYVTGCEGTPPSHSGTRSVLNYEGVIFCPNCILLGTKLSRVLSSNHPFVSMADAAGPIIRQVLVKLQIRALQRQHQRARNASDYDAALQRAALYTPRIVLQNSEQLNSLLLEDLTAAEIGCLIDAANSLVGAAL